MTLLGQPPELDLRQWSGLADALRKKYRVVREQVDNILPPGALAPWLYAPAGTLTYQILTASKGGATLATSTVLGNAAALRAYNATTSAAENLLPSQFGAVAFTLEGLSFSADTGFDFQFGFSGTAATVGGAYLFLPNGQEIAEIRSYDASNNLSKTPRFVTDAVLNGTTLITSATASFNSNDVNQPVGGAQGDSGLILPGTTIASVTSGTNAVMSIAALGSNTGQTVHIGQGINVQPCGAGTGGAGRFRRNLTFLWFPQDGYVWIMQDDQVLGEVNMAPVKYYTNAQTAEAQAAVTTEIGSDAFSMQWTRASLIYAHN